MMTVKMTFTEAKAALRKSGMTICFTTDHEFRVNFAHGREATAYYTDDITDAVNTAYAMKRGQA